MKTIRLLHLHIYKQVLRILPTEGMIMKISFIKYQNIRIQFLKKMMFKSIIQIKNLFIIMMKVNNLQIKTIWCKYKKMSILIIKMN